MVPLPAEPSRDDVLDDLLNEWGRRRLVGPAPTPEELAPDDAELRERLRLRILRVLLEERAVATVDEEKPPGGDSGAELTVEAPAAPPLTQEDALAPPGYTLTRELGRGGMGVVYHAVQQKLHRPAALKMVLSRQDDQRLLVRFLVEAEAMATVRHPNVAQVYECGEHQGRPFLALEYLEGGTLARRLKRAEALRPSEACSLLLKVARGVEAAHRQGIIHRDLKPDNILFDAAGEPKVTDFGLAKHGVGQDLTATQTTMGTPAYMAPEQARGETRYAGPPADVYALGVILYQCLTGTRPFEAERPVLILDKVINEPPQPPSRRAAHVPHDLEVICLKCLRKEPEKRYHSAGELADDLERYQKGEPIRARPVGRAERLVKWLRRNPTGTALAAFVLLALVGAAAAGVLHLRRLDDNRGRLLVSSLRTATPAELLRIRPDLLALRRSTEPAVRDLLTQSRATGDPRAELNAALLLVQWEPAEVDFVLERILDAPPEEIIACRELLEARAEQVQSRLELVVADRSAPRARRLRAQALLAREGAALSAELADELAGQLLVEDRLQLSGWVRALAPVRVSLLEPLSRRYAQGGDDEGGIGAALILREYLKGSAERIPTLIRRGGVRQAFILGAALRDSPADLNAVLGLWDRPESERLTPRGGELTFRVHPDEADDADARGQLRLGLALLAAGREEPVWRACAWSDNPRLRTNLVHAFAEVRLPPQALRRALAVGDDAVRQAVYLAWGDYAPDLWAAREFEEVVAAVSGDYEHHPDPGVHAAAEWLLKQWQAHDRIKTVLPRLPAEKTRGGRRWYVSPSGMTFAVIPGPSEARVGSHVWSPLTYSDPVHGPEPAHTRLIDRTYAIAIKEVTVRQASAFYRECGKYLNPQALGKNWATREDDCPAGGLNWYDAALFCRWLSEKEGVPEAQQCYPPFDQIKPGMRLPADHLRRTGYRLPTEAEWEHACRAGAATTFCFGSDLRHLPRYAWFDRNADMRTHPVGSLRPNRLGLFDIHGNVFEWCGVRDGPRPPGDTLLTNPDAPDVGECQPDDVCVLRGGDFPVGPPRQRCAHRTVVRRTLNWPASGLRVARTLAAPTLTVSRSYHEDGRVRFEVLGTPGRFRVSDESGNVVVGQREGPIPGPVDVYATGSTPARPFSFVVRRADGDEHVRVADVFVVPRWTLRWFRWTPLVNHPHSPPSQETWDKAVAGRAVFEETRSPLRFAWDRHEAAAVPESYAGMIATTEVDLPAGSYQFEGVSRQFGFRVYLDGEWLLEQDWLRELRRHCVVRYLAAGKHTLRVEYFKTQGPEVFDFIIRRVASPEAPGLTSAEGIWTSALFELTGTGEYKVDDISAGLSVARARGKVPAVLRVSGRDLHARPFAFTVRRTDDRTAGHLVRVWGTLTPGGLHIRPVRQNALGMRFALIPAGEFMRGSSAGFIEQQLTSQPDPDRKNFLPHEGPQHPVQISKPFGLGVTEVTVGQFRQYVRATTASTQAERPGADAHSFLDGKWHFDKAGRSWREPHNTRSEAHPVVQLGWHDACAFCEWLSKQDGVRYRLPSEAEWEYAARAGTPTTWFFGDDVDPAGDYLWHTENAHGAPQPVARKKPNPWGLHDVYGNVTEWCHDYYEERYYSRREPRDPGGPAGPTEWRSIRGGNIWDRAEDCRSAGRMREFPSRSSNLLGMRVATAPWVPSQQVRLEQVYHQPAHEYRVVGSPGPPEAAVRAGLVSATVAPEGSGATIRAVAKGEITTDYALAVRLPGRQELVVADTLLSASWDVRVFPIPRPATRRTLLLAGAVVGSGTSPVAGSATAHAASRLAGTPVVPAAPAESEWLTARTAQPVHKLRVPSLDFDWGVNSLVSAVPRNHFGLVATTELDIRPTSAGEYRLTALADDGVRVYLDDVLVLNAWGAGDRRLVSRAVSFQAGKRRLRVEYFAATTASAVLRFHMTRSGK